MAPPDTGNDRADFLVEGKRPPYRLFIPKGDMGDSLILERQSGVGRSGPFGG
jgi:hypothetical protein